MVKYEMKRGHITELVMLDNINNNNNNELIESDGTRTNSRARTPINNNILAMSKSQASSLCLNNLP